MGLKDRQSNVVYLRIKEHTYTEDGREKTKYGFATGKDDMPYAELEGKITSLSFKNEDYEGNPIRKLIVVINDGEDNYQFGLNVESSSYSSFVSFIANVEELSNTITIHPRLDKAVRDGKEISRRSILVSQNGNFAKSYFTKEDPKGLPEWKIVKVSGKNMADKTEYLEFLENFVNKELVPRISAEAVQVKKVEAKDFVQSEPTDDLPFSDGDSRLPWD